MTGQLGLFDRPRVGHAGPNPPRHRNHDPATSVEAAASLNPIKVGQQVALAVEAIRWRGCVGATVAELVEVLDVDRGNLARRVTDACQRGLVVDSGRRRRGPSGRAGIVWVAVDACHEAA